jgi:hypothetical protein
MSTRERILASPCLFNESGTAAGLEPIILPTARGMSPVNLY